MPVLPLIALALFIALSGCQLEAADADFAKSLVADLQARNLDAIEARSDPTLRDKRANLALIAEQLPPTMPISVEVAGWNWVQIVTVRGPRVRRMTVQLQYQFERRWLLVSARWRTEDGGQPIIEELLVQPLPASLEEINRFTLEGRGVLHYLVLALAVALPIYSLAVLVLCLRTPMRLGRKALWSLAILLGVATFHFNWTTGEVVVDPLRAQLLSAAYTRSGLGPWIFSLSFPLGAAVFLLTQPSLRASASARDLTN